MIWRRRIVSITALASLIALLVFEYIGDRVTGQAVSFALTIVCALVMSTATGNRIKVEVASQISRYPHRIGELSPGDIVVLAPRPTTGLRAADRYSHAYIVTRATLAGHRVLTSIATGDQLALPLDRMCVRVYATLTVEVDS